MLAAGKREPLLSETSQLIIRNMLAHPNREATRQINQSILNSETARNNNKTNARTTKCKLINLVLWKHLDTQHWLIDDHNNSTKNPLTRWRSTDPPALVKCLTRKKKLRSTKSAWEDKIKPCTDQRKLGYQFISSNRSSTSTLATGDCTWRSCEGGGVSFGTSNDWTVKTIAFQVDTSPAPIDGRPTRQSSVGWNNQATCAPWNRILPCSSLLRL